MQALDQAIPDLEDVAEPSTKVFCCAPRCPISESAVGEALDDDPITLLDVVEIGDFVYDEAEQLADVAEQLRHFLDATRGCVFREADIGVFVEEVERFTTGIGEFELPLGDLLGGVRRRGVCVCHVVVPSSASHARYGVIGSLRSTKTLVSIFRR
jgi:hypothetical protein